jgi:ribonucleotide reductase class II
MNIRIIKTDKKAKQAAAKFQTENKLDNHKNSEDHFRLEDAFVNRYRNKKANFGFNGLGELVFYRTYSRPLPHNPKQKESFCDTVKRVVEGCYEIQRRHSVKIHVPWDYKKAQNSAQEMFQRIWDFKFLPPGRGLWMMGTEFMWTRGSAALNNCGFVSTVDVDSEPAEPFCFLMDMSMLGVGVGFDTKGAGKMLIKRPSDNTFTHVVDDSREGWVESLRILINSYSTNNRDGTPEFDYSKIRKEDEPIKGFGGKAAGPGILMNLHKMFRNHFDSKIGQSLDSVDIVDLMNYIGKCVVAGNVRRCLPKGTLIHLKRGLTPIEKVQVGDLVLTADGYHPVAENVQQGIQNVITINSQLGQFRCTEKHRIAVMTGIGEYGWKRANQLKPGDKMVFVDNMIPGTATVLPGYSDMSTRGTKLAIPGLTGDVSWFIGMIHGDGYVYNGRSYKNKKRHGASVAVAFNRDQYHDAILEKVKEGFGAFGFTPRDHKSNDNCHKLRVTSSKLSEYFSKNFKKARKPLDVPECIRLGTPEIRSAYLAGLLDSDGSTKNRPTTLVSSVYKNFIRQVQAVYSSLGIPTKLKLRCEAEGNSQAKWELSLVGEFAINKFLEIIQPWAVKQLRETAHSGHDFGFPSSWINRETVDYGRSWSPDQSQMTYNRAVLCEAQTKSLIPVEIESIVDEGVAVETYDLSVPDRSEFVAEGLLVHNTAEIAFGEYDDEQYSSMKNCMKTLLPEDYSKWYQVTGRLYSESAKNNTQVAAQLNDFIDNETFVIPIERLVPAIEIFNKLNSHRWASNNSIFAKVGMDYTNVAQQIQVNGEPGLIYLDNVRDYGRMIDGKRPGIDGRVAGSNPCLAGNMRLFTSNGYKTIEELWAQGGYQEYDGSPTIAKHGQLDIINRNGLVPATNVYRTSEEAEIFRVQLSDGQHIDATVNHRFIVVDGDNEIRFDLKDLTPGLKLPLSQFSSFGCHDDPDYAILAGWVIGDGSLSPQRDGQVTAHVTCYQSDIEDVLPILSVSLSRLYTAHNKPSNQNPGFRPWDRVQEHFDHQQSGIRSNVLGRLLKSDGVVPGNKHQIPSSIWSGNKPTIAAFLRGLFGADGSVQINDKRSCVSVRLPSIAKSLLNDCQLLLTQFGISSSVSLRRKSRIVMMNDGKGGKKPYVSKDMYELIISGRHNVELFGREIGFMQPHKQERLCEWLETHKGSANSKPRTTVRICSIDYVGKKPTYCLTEVGSHELAVNGVGIGNCVEQSLESYELCVSGNTKIQLRSGIRNIESLIGQSVEVWNGDGWSTVTPRITGQNRELYRVHLSDGSYLDTTSNHGWSVRPVGKRVYRRVETLNLQTGDRVQSFTLAVEPSYGLHEKNAFEMGYTIGDGYIDQKGRYPMAVACGHKAKLQQLSMKGRWYKPQIKEGYSDLYHRINLSDSVTVEQAIELRNKEAGLPEWVMSFDRESILQFIAGWIESDGTVCKQKNTEGYRIYGLEAKIRDAQLLLRRIGINHATVNFCHPAGQQTNKGIRKNDLWYIQIPSFESGEIPTRVKKAVKIGSRIRKNPRYPDRKIDMAKKQYVERVEKLEGLHTTYCFNEPDNHMGVFGNSITYQCNLVETFPANHENAEDYMRTLKFAYLYAKTVTLLPTHNARTNQVTLRNRRIGLSQSGIIQAFAKFGRRAMLQDFCDAGYNEIKRWDNIYSEWLCVTQSIKVTSVKPSGCRPWHALTTTSGGILTLEELFEVSGHQVDQQWCDMPDGLFAVQGDSHLRPITSEDGSNVCVATVTDRITKTYDNGISDIITIKLSHNIELESTPNHQWFVSHRYVRSKKHRYELCNKWKRADQIEPDDVIHVEPGVYESFEHSKLIKLGNRSVVMRGGKSYSIKQPTAMNPDLAWLLGYMWGDGSQSYSKYRMRYSDEHLFNLHKAQRIILDQFGLETSIKPASQGRNSYQLEVGSKELWHWLLINDCLKIKSNHDLVPKCVRASGHEDIIAFLAGLCDSDGCIGRRHNDQYAILTMAGKMFAKHIQDVALTVGIVFSRSLNSAGENFQQEKSMWSLSSMKTTLKDRFEYFKKHCNKVQEKSADVPWSHELGQPSRILGKVLKIGKGVRQRTYDVEVENSHWYYAGAVKSHNTVSLLVGATPGIHNPEARHYWRRVRIAKNNPLVKILADAGYHIEPVISDPERTVVVKFAVSDSRVKPVGETTIWEQMANAIDYQRYWADNQVSCTVKFKSSEVDQIKLVLETYEDQIKGISFLPFSDHGYAQAPYEPCTEQEVLDYNARIKPADYSSYILEAVGSTYCDNDSCEMPQK